MESVSSPVSLAVIIGSLRQASIHRLLADTMAEIAPPGIEFTEASVGDVPFYDQDVEDAGEPPSVSLLRATVGAADGLVFVTPEYNGSMPATVKNAVDWLSRPYGSGAIAAKPTLIVSATPGRHDAANVRSSLAFSAGVAGAAVREPTLGLASITRRITEGRCDDDVRAELRTALDGFIDAIRRGPAED